MTQTNEQIQALQAAEGDTLALNAYEISNQLRHLADNEIDSDSFAVVIENYNGQEVEFERPITDLAIDAAEMMDKLLAEREADKALIAELEGKLKNVRDGLDYWAKRNAENEGAAGRLFMANKRIAELEARTLTVKLPREYTCYHGGPDGDDFRERCYLKDDVLSMFAAAGITLVVGGEDATN